MKTGFAPQKHHKSLKTSQTINYIEDEWSYLSSLHIIFIFFLFFPDFNFTFNIFFNVVFLLSHSEFEKFENSIQLRIFTRMSKEIDTENIWNKFEKMIWNDYIHRQFIRFLLADDLVMNAWFFSFLMIELLMWMDETCEYLLMVNFWFYWK